MGLHEASSIATLWTADLEYMSKQGQNSGTIVIVNCTAKEAKAANAPQHACSTATPSTN